MYNLKTIEIRKQTIDWILSKGPYEYFITLTFKYDQGERKCHSQANHLIRLLNRRLFGRNNKTDYLEGYVFIENHSHHRDSVHYHLAIKYHNNFDISGKKHFIEHFYDCLRRVKTDVKFNVFGKKKIMVHTSVQENQTRSLSCSPLILVKSSLKCTSRIASGRRLKVRNPSYCRKRVVIEGIFKLSETYDYLRKKTDLNDEECKMFRELTESKESTKNDAFCAKHCEVTKTYDDRKLIDYLTKRFEDDGDDASFAKELNIDGFCRLND